MKRFYRLLALILVLSTFSLFSASCMGSFALTHKLYNWNKNDIGNKWLSSFILFVFLVLPVYGIAGLIDWVILNVIEFYSGHNPIAEGESVTKTAQIGDSTVTLTFLAGDGVNLNIVTTDAAGNSKILEVRSVDEHGMVAKLSENGKMPQLFAVRKGAANGIDRFADGGWKYLNEEAVVETLDNLDSMQAVLAAQP